MNILDTEEKIIDRLKEKITDLRVEGYPDDPGTYSLKHPNGAILVRYQDSTYTEPESFTVSQKQNAAFDITIITKNLRTNTGAYAYLEAVKSALTGYRIPDLARLYPTRDGFILHDRGVWYYGITFAFIAIHEED